MPIVTPWGRRSSSGSGSRNGDAGERVAKHEQASEQAGGPQPAAAHGNAYNEKKQQPFGRSLVELTGMPGKGVYVRKNDSPRHVRRSARMLLLDEICDAH
jgi:hypothetical protein